MSEDDVVEQAKWRAMQTVDLAAVSSLGDLVHVNYPEDAGVFAERLRLYPAGCFLLEGEAGSAIGYAVTHPWHFKKPPELNSMLGALPEPASSYYIHDIALLPAGRGSGAASRLVAAIIAHARETGAPNISLIAVNGSIPFWARHGFEVDADPALDAKLKSYDDDARFMVRPSRT
ncbi:MAG: GNAT family N-acetyltransferase [Hyphomicrobium sp.]